MLKRFSFGIAVCSFAQDGYETDTADAPSSSWREAEPDTNRTARIGQAGNAMHVQCMGVVLIHILSRGNMRRDVEPEALVPAAAAAPWVSGSSSSTAPSPAPLSAGLLGMARMVLGPFGIPKRRG